MSGTEKPLRRRALVIGNAKYGPRRNLYTPVNDAKAVFGVLREIGFECLRLDKKVPIDLDREQFNTAVNTFVDIVSKDKPDVALFYYTGHGLQIGGGNYLVPTGIETDNLTVGQVQRNLVSLDKIISWLGEGIAEGERQVVVIVGSCRKSKITDEISKAAGGKELFAPTVFKSAGFYLAFSTQPGQLALDFLKDANGEKAPKGPFASALLNHIRTTGLEIDGVFRRVCADVVKATSTEHSQFVQVPWSSSSLFPGLCLAVDGLGETPNPKEPNSPFPSDDLLDTERQEERSHVLTDDLFREHNRVLDDITKGMSTIRTDVDQLKLKQEANIVRFETILASQADQQGALRRMDQRISELVANIAELKAKQEDDIAHIESVLNNTYATEQGKFLTEIGERLPALSTELRQLGETLRADIARVESALAREKAKRENSLQITVGNCVTNVVRLIVPGHGLDEQFQDIPEGPQMVVVPAGNLKMGYGSARRRFKGSWREERAIEISKPFAVGRFAVTFAEWDAANLPHKPGDHQNWGRGKRPVINVSWEDAKSYVAWLSKRTCKTYRLLSEAEWEYCCRAGTNTAFAFGDTITQQQAQFSAYQTAEVGTFSPNAWGLHDMHGNVWEWCEDNWHPDYEGAPNDGSMWPGGDTSLRVLRGGSWSNYPLNLRSSIRFKYRPTDRFNFVGFRVARAL